MGSLFRVAAAAAVSTIAHVAMADVVSVPPPAQCSRAPAPEWVMAKGAIVITSPAPLNKSLPGVSAALDCKDKPLTVKSDRNELRLAGCSSITIVGNDNVVQSYTGYAATIALSGDRNRVAWNRYGRSAVTTIDSLIANVAVYDASVPSVPSCAARR